MGRALLVRRAAKCQGVLQTETAVQPGISFQARGVSSMRQPGGTAGLGSARDTKVAGPSSPPWMWKVMLGTQPCSSGQDTAAKFRVKSTRAKARRSSSWREGRGGEEWVEEDCTRVRVHAHKRTETDLLARRDEKRNVLHKKDRTCFE